MERKWYIISTDLDTGKTTWDASQRKRQARVSTSGNPQVPFGESKRPRRPWSEPRTRFGTWRKGNTWSTECLNSKPSPTRSTQTLQAPTKSATPTPPTPSPSPRHAPNPHLLRPKLANRPLHPAALRLDLLALHEERIRIQRLHESIYQCIIWKSDETRRGRMRL
jgi:hypothetical protein